MLAHETVYLTKSLYLVVERKRMPAGENPEFRYKRQREHSGTPGFRWKSSHTDQILEVLYQCLRRQ